MQVWTVILVQAPVPNTYRGDYFPRRFRYKKEAEVLKREVEAKGGKVALIKGL